MKCRASAGLILRLQGRPTISLSLRCSKPSRQHHQQGRIGLIGLTIGEMCGNWVMGKNPWNKHVPQFSLETQDIKGPGVAYFYHPEMHFGSERPETVIPSWKLWAKKWTFNCGSWTKCPRLTDFMKLRSSLAQLRCWFGVLWWVGQIGQACAVSYDDVQLLVDATHPNPKHVLGVQAGIFLPKQAAVASSNIYSRL